MMMIMDPPVCLSKNARKKRSKVAYVASLMKRVGSLGGGGGDEEAKKLVGKYGMVLFSRT